jgi:hypothetical protein
MQEKDRHRELQIALDGDSVELVLCRRHLWVPVLNVITLRHRLEPLQTAFQENSKFCFCLNLIFLYFYIVLMY